jgi:hypothetical protein
MIWPSYITAIRSESVRISSRFSEISKIAVPAAHQQILHEFAFQTASQPIAVRRLAHHFIADENVLFQADAEQFHAFGQIVFDKVATQTVSIHHRQAGHFLKNAAALELVRNLPGDRVPLLRAGSNSTIFIGRKLESKLLAVVALILLSDHPV